MSREAAADNEVVRLQELHSDESGIVVAWLVRLLVGLAIAGVVLFDVGAIVVNYVSVQDAAGQVAVGIETDLASGGDVVPNLSCNRRSRHQVCESAYELARDQGVRVTSASFDPNGVFHVEVEGTADTLLVSRIGPIESWATATGTAEASAD